MTIEASRPEQNTTPASAPPRSLRANLASLATSQVITWTLTLAWTVIVPRTLGPADMGLLVIAQSLTALVAVALNLPPKDYLVREMVANPADLRGILSTSLIVRGASLPLMLLAVSLYGNLADMSSTALTVLYFVAGATYAAMLLEPVLATFQATERMQYIAYTDVANKTLQTMGAIVVVLLGYGVVEVAGYSLAVVVLALAIALVWVNRLVGLGARPSPLRRLLRGGLPYWAVSLSGVAYLWLDSLMLGLLTPTEVVGWYGTATRLFTTMMFGAVIISTASLPRLVKAFQRGRAELLESAREPLIWVLLIGLPLSFGMAAVADDIVGLLFGAEFSQAVPVLVVLALTLPLMYVNIMVGQLFIASGRPGMIGMLLVTAALVNAGLNAVLIPLTQAELGNGGVGAALALLTAEAIQMSLGIALAGRGLMDRHVVSRVLRAGLAAVAMATLVLLADSQMLAVQVAIGALAYPLLLMLLRVPTTDECRALQTARRAAARRVPGLRNSRWAGDDVSRDEVEETER